jgi:hypothetical protein
MCRPFLEQSTPHHFLLFQSQSRVFGVGERVDAGGGTKLHGDGHHADLHGALPVAVEKYHGEGGGTRGRIAVGGANFVAGRASYVIDVLGCVCCCVWVVVVFGIFVVCGFFVVCGLFCVWVVYVWFLYVWIISVWFFCVWIISVWIISVWISLVVVHILCYCLLVLAFEYSTSQYC